jgi:elongation factor P
VEILHTTTNKLEFSYVDADGYHFMDIETYEDTVLGNDMIAEDKQYLVEGNSYDVLFVDGKAVKLELPVAVETTVMDAPEGIRGDTASNVQKPVTIDTGMTVQVPLFIKRGEKIRVSTTDGSYLGRAGGN